MNINNYIRKLAAGILLACQLVQSVMAGDFERLYYDTITGNPMANFRNAVDPQRSPSDPFDVTYWSFPQAASFSEAVTVGFQRVELSGISPDNFASFIRVYVQAPLSGDYQFYVAADDSVELYLSADHTPLNLKAPGNFLSPNPKPLAYEDGGVACCAALFSGTRLEIRRSAPVTLEKGKLYYMEVYHKEGGGGAWVQVGWERPDGVVEEIPARSLFPFISPDNFIFTAEQGIVGQPQSQTIRENFPVTFTVNPVMNPPLTFQWLDNGVAIPGENLAFFTLPSAARALDGHRYSVRVNATTSSEAVLTVPADTAKPVVVSAFGSGVPHGILVTYDKPMEAASAGAAANYSITGQSLTVSAVEILSPTEVLLKVPIFNTNALSVVINNVKDATVAGNVIAANTTVPVDLAMHGLLVAKLFTGMTRGADGTGASEVARTRALPNYPDNPGWSGTISGINVPATSDTFGPGGNVEDFQTFVRGYITPPESGEYWFYISSDDPSAFYLSTDSSFANLPPVDFPTLWEDGCCRALGTEAEGLYTAVILEAGKRYAFEAYAAEYGGGDYLQVGWKTPGNSQVSVVPASAVSMFWPSATLTIGQQPASQTVLENTPVTFTVGVSGSDPFVIQYQWLRNGEPIPGATGTSYRIEATTAADNAAKFSVMAANRNGTFNTVTSAEAVLTVSTDFDGPTVTKVAGDGSFMKAFVTFSEPVSEATATNLANYTLAGGLTASSATLSADGQTVALTTSRQTEGTSYGVTINGIKDVSPGGNMIAANTMATLHAWVFGKGFVKWESFNGIGGTAVSGLTNAAKYPNSPDETLFMSRFDSKTVRPDDSRENYGARVTGWFIPEATGDYVFYLRSDDASELYLSSDETAANKMLIAEQTGCCNSFDAAPPLASFPITLTAGRRYYIEGLMKEGGGGDYLKVAMKGPGEDLATPPGTSGNNVVDMATIPGRLLGTYLTPDAVVHITNQPSNQGGSVASAGVPLISENFNSGDGGMTVETTGTPPGPWRYDASTGTWIADNGNDACGDPNNSALNSQEYTMAQAGFLTLKLTHRYSFEPTWDGGQVRMSVNGGAFTEVPAANFLENGYAAGNLVGAGVLNGKRAFSGDSEGYPAGEFITSTASLGVLKQGDKVRIQFIAGWDECTTATIPNWQIDSFGVSLLPMIVQDFAAGNGNFTVQNDGTPPGPWTYDTASGSWIANNGNDACGDPNNSKLISPAYTVPQDDEVTLSFVHRYSFEPTWDGGQVQISVNGGAFTAIPAESFTANGYTEGGLVGTGVLNGQRTFSGDSSGYAANAFITSSAVLGEFQQGDTIAVRFVGAWDECSTASIPNWQMKSLSLSFGKAAEASTFEVGAVATLYGDPIQIAYQWQRNDGTGFVDIAGATSPVLTFYPTPADLDAMFRVVVSTIGKTATSAEVRLVEGGVATPPIISIATQGTSIVIQYTGVLQASETVDGPYANVPNAQSPYTAPAGGTKMFYRSAQ